jgi:hypothetical protein
MSWNRRSPLLAGAGAGPRAQAGHTRADEGQRRFLSFLHSTKLEQLAAAS